MKRDVQYTDFPETLSKVYSLTMVDNNIQTTYINKKYNGGSEMETKLYNGLTGEITNYK